MSDVDRLNIRLAAAAVSRGELEGLYCEALEGAAALCVERDRMHVEVLRIADRLDALSAPLPARVAGDLVMAATDLRFALTPSQP